MLKAAGCGIGESNIDISFLVVKVEFPVVSTGTVYVKAVLRVLKQACILAMTSLLLFFFFLRQYLEAILGGIAMMRSADKELNEGLELSPSV